MEFIITITCIIAIAARFWIGNRRRELFLILMLSLFVIHIVIQGIRWQMYLVYLFIAFELVVFIINRLGKGPKRNKEKRNWKSILWILGLIISLILIILFPYNHIEKPSGSYEVGTFSMDIVDENRIEIYGDTIGEPRKIRIQLWYPTDSTDGLDRAKWLNDGVKVASGIPSFAGMPGFLLRYTARIDSNSYLYATLSDDKSNYPIIVVSHGWFGFRNIHTDFCEMLASNGYIVASIDHTYGSLATVFNDGTVKKVDPNALPDASTVDDFSAYSNKLVTTYALDAELTINTIEKLAAGQVRLDNYTNTKDLNKLEDTSGFSGMFEGRINIDMIGAIGHSTGGGGITQLAMIDDRMDAVFGFDPWVEPIEENLLNQGLSTPSIFISSEQWQNHANRKYLKIIADSDKTVTKMYQLNGTSHKDFTMMYMFEPISRIIGMSGTIDSSRSIEIQKDFLLQFFDHYLLGKDNELNILADKYDEIVETDYK